MLIKHICHIFQNAYTATAINSTNFCTSAREAFLILVENALRVAAINTVGDFVLFLGKVANLEMFPVSSWSNHETNQSHCFLSGAHRLLYGVCWRPGSELPEGLHSVGAASSHRLSVCLPGGTLLPVCVWECGWRPLPLLCCGHKV